MKGWLIVLGLIILFLIVARLDNPKDYEDSELTAFNKQEILEEWEIMNGNCKATDTRISKK